MDRNNKIYAVIPKKRGKTAQQTILTLSVFLFLVGCSLVKDASLYILLAGSVNCVLICLKEVLFRISLLYEERKHLRSRYDNDWTLLIQNAASFSPCFIVTIFITSTYLVSLYFRNLNLFRLLEEFGIYANLCAVLAVQLFSTIIEMDHGPLHQAIMLEKLHGLDYGASMAYSYFHGYLKIILPHKGTEQKGIRELMQDFESYNGISFAYDKLIILIPMSLYCPPNLENHSKIIELAQSLGEIRVSRGGVHDRVYKSTAYKIKTPSVRRYVCAEYATPLKTLHEIISNNNEHASIYKKHKNELINQFYLTLRDILDNAPDCKDFCDLLLFNDKTADNTLEDVGEVILHHLNSQETQ